MLFASILNNIGRVSRRIVILEDSIIITEQYLYQRMEMIKENTQILTCGTIKEPRERDMVSKSVKAEEFFVLSLSISSP